MLTNKDIIKKGNVNRVKIKKGDKVIADPANGALGLAGGSFPTLAVLGALGTVATLAVTYLRNRAP